ncbi:hypothetical protein COCC4DRAFT_155228, partial [Bipolaris maydis ATCC 48331]
RSASNAPCTSIVTIVTRLPTARACSTSCVNAATMSIADRFGTAPTCCGLMISCVIAVVAILLATRRSSPLPMHESRAIGRIDRADVRSFFPAFGIIVTSATRQQPG